MLTIEFRINDRESVAIQCEYTDFDSSEPAAVPEITAARVSNENLSHLTTNQILSVAGQAIDVLTSVSAPHPFAEAQKENSPWSADDIDSFRSGKNFGVSPTD